MGNRSGEEAARVAVVIVSHQSAQTIAAAVRSVRESPLVGSVVVVDSGSADASVEAALGAGADEAVVLGANLGFAAGVNRGLAALADGWSPDSAPSGGHPDFMLLLNPDAELAPADLKRLVAALDADPAAVIAGPMLVDADDPAVRRPGAVRPGARRFSTLWNRFVLELPWVWRQPWAGPELRTAGPELRSVGPVAVPVDYVWGAALLARAGFLEAVGGLDERFLLYHEDEDLGRRARAFGGRVLLVTDAAATHVGAASSSGDAALAHARLLFATSQLLEKWSWPASGRVFYLGALKGLALQALAGVARGDSERAREQLRCARLLRGFRRAGSARP